MYEKIKRFYDMGLWTTQMVRNAVSKRVITADEYAVIVGEDFE